MQGFADVEWGNQLDRVPSDMDELADAWIRDDVAARRTDAGRDTDRPDFWAWEAADYLARHHPDGALSFILAAIDRPISEETRFSLAAGPLEDLLVHHGPSVIAEVERLARQRPEFRNTLVGVWQNAMGEDIWRRVSLAAGR
ncbi:hypothetical protein PRN20_02005 [Devosia sp. ZB163]|uniref:DUF6869 domain-containing protein n=1 Tax=Devosia sp. ZB163 TaxID=3025938 RepID=UPI00235EEC61|nr:hypothetical protein [Devosia sp. ZB163]MDC9822493.1 hypothetical protein [Devosia sp. ZB163]